MHQKHYYVLSIINLLLIFTVALSGLFCPSIYQTKISGLSIPMIQGQDCFSVIAGIIMVIALVLSSRGSVRGLILWLGCLSYFTYTYAYYPFSGITTIFYLPYIAIFSLSIFSFIGLLLSFDIKQFVKIIHKKIPRVPISLFLLFCVLSVGMMEIFHIIQLMAQNKISSIQLQDAYVILDLGLLFPAMAITAILSLKKNNWGLLLSGVFLVKTVTLLPAIICSDLFSYIYTGKFIDINFDIMASIFTIIALVLCFFYFKNIGNIKAEKKTNFKH